VDDLYYHKRDVSDVAPASPEYLANTIRGLYPYIEQQIAQGSSLHYVCRHTLGLFQGLPGARRYRRYLSENAYKKGSGTDILEAALQQMNL